jgi:hypothetical protein
MNDIDLNTQKNAALVACMDIADLCMDGLWATDIAPNLSCSDAEVFARVMRIAGRDREEIYNWLYAHAAGDDDDEDLHHPIYLKRQEDNGCTS